MLELVEDGRLTSAGVSNFEPDHLTQIIDATGVTPVVNQIEAHPYLRNDDARRASHSHVQRGDIISPKSMHRERMIENMQIFDFELTAEQIARIDALDKGEAGRQGPNPNAMDRV